KARFSIYNQLAINLQGLGQTEQAMELLQSAIEKFPSHANAHVALGNVLKDLGDVPGSIESYRRALKLDPQSKLAHSNLVYTMLFDPRYDMPAIAQELSRWNQLHAEPLKSEIKPHDNDRASGRRLRIGYVSPDFRNHVIGRNVLPLFKHHNHSQFEIFCYSITKRPDSITDEFRQLADQWRDIGDLTDEQIVAQIRADQIDILVDLALHLNDGRLAVFARKPAPVQVTFAGYPGSTGLTAIDCRPTDPFLEPQGMFDQYSSEKPIRALQSFWCFDPFDSDVPVSPLPAIDNGFITFACFNNFAKVNEQMTGLWSRVLQSVANSRMVILSDKGRHRERIERQLGIDPKRIEFVTQTSRLNYLKHHQRVDICLDTLPYNGHSTSLDALWMGVPVVIIVGQTPVGRAGLSIMTNIVLPELVAYTVDDFVKIAVDLANDTSRLKMLRSTLRQKLESSVLMDAGKFAWDMESFYRAQWREWINQPKV
ncbi:MAG TPA: tetratricopeptide repeat protein, partial [Tepidisphaeraceae bacterium]|nr:tetratricopeptide repeat protein [Tepidisphaeraceae bacterium]